MKPKRYLAAATAGAVAAAVLAFGAGSADAGPGNGPGHDNGKGHGRQVDLQLLAINDFHGNLEAGDGLTHELHGEEVPAGGAEYLATHLEQARDGQRYSTTVAAGDLIGASPFLSAAFGDEPTIESLNAMGVEVSSVGNHEFDKGIDDLNRHIEGEADYAGADFPYLGANVVDEATGEPVLEPYWIKKFKGGVRVGFIGMTLEGTGDIVAKSGIEGIEFLDEVETAEKYAAELTGRGVDSIVVLLHEGGVPVAEDTGHDCESLDGSGVGMSGPIVDIAEDMTAEVDIVVTGHTHQEYVCSVPDPAGQSRMVTSASSYGRVFTEIEASYDKRTKDIVRSSVTGSNTVVTRDVEPDPFQTDLVQQHLDDVEEVANRPVGYIAEDITRGETRAEEFGLGSLIADAQLERTADPDFGGADIAFMNPGGVRADLLYDEGDPGVVTYGELYTVQPFNNYLVTMDLTGDQILTMLRQQLPGEDRDTTLFMQVSEGFTYTWDTGAEGTNQIVADSLTLHGEPIAADQTYRVTVNSFLADGGDSFHVLAEGTDRVTGEIDLDAFEAWFAENSSPESPVEAPEPGRVNVI
ncbi:bifunctional metallophosphatase/5'-nucleotidase [Glycomyces xiaoerkulensis]|uniref:bifunctional metallophosphatase/5'-nucleotidase n=1 Tax=Glycomyces xiaoerkulensis TaxID=2038139 RepID=UPI000C25970F|nr:bifunctional metallophosphatase/5'-nucleotidase [Glycomyces xiaoerkulensis]